MQKQLLEEQFYPVLLFPESQSFKSFAKKEFAINYTPFSARWETEGLGKNTSQTHIA